MSVYDDIDVWKDRWKLGFTSDQWSKLRELVKGDGAYYELCGNYDRTCAPCSQTIRVYFVKHGDPFATMNDSDYVITDVMVWCGHVDHSPRQSCESPDAKRAVYKKVRQMKQEAMRRILKEQYATTNTNYIGAGFNWNSNG